MVGFQSQRRDACGALLAPKSASVPAHVPNAAHQLAEALGPGPFALIVLFVSHKAQLAPLLTAMQAAYAGAASVPVPVPVPVPVIGCTTAGEISDKGYDTGQIIALAFPQASFAAEPVIIENIRHIDTRRIVSTVLDARQALARRADSYPHDLAILLVDGLSGQEEALVAALTGGLGQVPMIGGSAGDAGEFRKAAVFAHGRVLQDAAILCLLRSRGEVRNFSLDHTSPSAARMIVTAADPANRAVTRINDEPAALEYARLLGLPIEALSSFVFATRPVLVRAGGRYHVRAIQNIGADQSLVFFSAIAEGMVLTLSDNGDLAEHLSQELDRFTRLRRPEIILGFDCIFRRIDAEGRQKGAEVSRILSQHRVIGFSTYGEQYGALHVNQTLTGVAFYPPEPAP